MIREAVHRLRMDESLSEMVPLLAYFAAFVMKSEMVRQIMGSEMMVLEKNPWYNEILMKGATQGRQEGLQDGILDFLEAKFGDMPKAVAEKVRQVRDLDRLHDLHRRASLVGSLEEFLTDLNRSNPTD